MAALLRWGIMGTGNIACQFADGLAGSRLGRAVAVGSRQGDTAAAFARQYHIEHAWASYADLLAHKQVDAIYLSLPNSMHHEWALKALAAGKHVLCEKPFARTVAESEQMFDAAHKQGLLLVEAFMYRSHPLTAAVQRKIADGAIGKLKMIRSSFCYRTTRIEGNIRFNRQLAGGSLMDIGCYCINFSRHFADEEPVAVTAAAHIGAGGVDDMLVATMRFANGILAGFTCGMCGQVDNTAYLCGTDGYLEVPIPWKPPQEKAYYRLKHSVAPRQDKDKTLARLPDEHFYIDADRPLYALEADDFAAAVTDGKPPTLSRADTIGNMQVLDEMRRQIGLTFD